MLSQEEIDWCRSEGIELAYDPVQIGWVPLQSEVSSASSSESNTGRLVAVAAATHAGPPLRFRPWRSDDVSTLVALLDDAEVWRHMPEPYPAPLTAELASNLIEVAGIEGHHEVRAVECDGVIVGQVRLLFDGHGADRTRAEISYWLGREHWGRGIGRTLVAEATEQAFRRHPSLRTLFARVRPENRASSRALERAGYKLVPFEDGWLGYERRAD